jgi:hypothetical protein
MAKIRMIAKTRVLVNLPFDAEIPELDWQQAGNGDVQHAVNREDVEEANRAAATKAETLVESAFKEFDVVSWQIEEVNHAP